MEQDKRLGDFQWRLELSLGVGERSRAEQISVEGRGSF